MTPMRSICVFCSGLVAPGYPPDGEVMTFPGSFGREFATNAPFLPANCESCARCCSSIVFLTGRNAMFDRMSRSWELVKASWSVLGEDKELLVFPLISSLAMLAVVACFALPVLGIAGFDGITRALDGKVSPTQYAVGFLFYVVQYFVAFYFNAALVGAAM